MSQPTALVFPAGIQRDGTRFDSDACGDAQWTRWRLKRPRKIKGYQELVDNLVGNGRCVHMFYQGARTIIHVGTSKSLEQIVIDRDGNVLSHNNRTPAAFPGGLSVGWTLDALFDTTSSVVQLMAHAVPNTDLLADTTASIPFLGQIDATGPLAPFTAPPLTYGGTYVPPAVAGGIMAVQPFVFAFDTDGGVKWSAPNQPLTLGVTGGTSGAGAARISAQKIVAGRPLRGGGANFPAMLFWSLSEVIVCSFSGGVGQFSFNTVSPESSILSGQSVIEYDGLYYWAGVDRFLVYNGTVVEVENSQNQDWFFDNINRNYAGKSFAFKVPRFGEIWFCAPLFGNTEPSHALILNVRDKCWYDTVLPNGGRGAGYFAQGFPFPVMSGVTQGPNGYSLWLHEKGYDQVALSGVSPVRSYHDTPIFGGPSVDPPNDSGVSVQQLEADIAQTGDMVVSLVGAGNPRAAAKTLQAAHLKAIPATPGEQLIGFKASNRLSYLRFESNVLNGNYVMGRSLMHVDKGDASKPGALGDAITSPPDETAENPSAPLTDSSVPLSEFTT